VTNDVLSGAEGKPTSGSGECRMQDPRYLRSQAEFCLKLAARTDRPQTAENLRNAATRYVSQADEIENKGPRSASAPEE
jgi:hypothetical protein